MNGENQTPPTAPAGARAEEMMGQWGRTLGSVLGMAGRSLQNASQAARSAANQAERSAGSAPRGPASSQEANARAEQLVDQFGQQVEGWSRQAGHEVQRAFALLREELEDMWAEAQSIRNDNMRR